MTPHDRPLRDPDLERRASRIRRAPWALHRLPREHGYPDRRYLAQQVNRVDKAFRVRVRRRRFCQSVLPHAQLPRRTLTQRQKVGNQMPLTILILLVLSVRTQTMRVPHQKRHRSLQFRHGQTLLGQGSRNPQLRGLHQVVRQAGNWKR